MANVTALFVAKNGVYFGQDDVDPWDESRDARGYHGPQPVVAHPPCQRWGNFWYGGPSAPNRRFKGDDDGCFASALYSVRTFGGVLKHPAYSHAWKWFGLGPPQRSGRWTQPDSYGGRSCSVEQGNYGHQSKKATWLYGVGLEFPELVWGPSNATRPLEHLSHKQRASTPEPFADLLIGMCKKTNLKENK